MKWFRFSRSGSEKHLLRDYIRLVIAFYGCLLLLCTYQQVQLYTEGILDGVFKWNLLLLAVHNLGFASLSALVFAFVFQFIENRKPGWGFRIAVAFFFALLLSELILTVYFLEGLVLPAYGMSPDLLVLLPGKKLFLTAFTGMLILGSAYRLLYRYSKASYSLITKMYPFTLIVFSLFLATLWSPRKPVNQNKVQYMVTQWFSNVLDRDAYAGDDPFPFYKTRELTDPLGPYLNWPDTPPNILIIGIEGLSSDFVGEMAPLRGITPFLDSLSAQSLFWGNYLSNTHSPGQLPGLLLASAPQGKEGFISREHLPNRISLLSLLKKNGYRTSFQYGGNSVLWGWDRFLASERVDEVSDRKAFGKQYNEQEPDAAGISVGYPDEALFHRYLRLRVDGPEPRLDYFQTLSASRPYNIPDAGRYEQKVLELVESAGLERRQQRHARKNRDFLGAMHYTDQQLRKFFGAFRKLPGYRNTLVLITGSHRPGSLADDSPLNHYQVPLLIAGPLLKGPQAIPDIASHLDVAPSLLGSLLKRYGFEVPDKTAWIGGDLIATGHDSPKIIPLYRPGGGAGYFIEGNWIASKNRVFELADNLEVTEAKDSGSSSILKDFRDFRAAERYAVSENALIPQDAVIYNELFREPEPRDQIWIQSVFSGNDYDDAYMLARQLAHDGDWDRAITLCQYILSRVPGHIDTEVLLGRIHAWDGNYELATGILEQVVHRYPVYADGYAALLDTYYWSKNNGRARYLLPAIETYHKDNIDIQSKLKRSLESI